MNLHSCGRAGKSALVKCRLHVEAVGLGQAIFACGFQFWISVIGVAALPSMVSMRKRSMRTPRRSRAADVLGQPLDERFLLCLRRRRDAPEADVLGFVGAGSSAQ